MSSKINQFQKIVLKCPEIEVLDVLKKAGKCPGKSSNVLEFHFQNSVATMQGAYKARKARDAKGRGRRLGAYKVREARMARRALRCVYRACGV